MANSSKNKTEAYDKNMIKEIYTIALEIEGVEYFLGNYNKRFVAFDGKFRFFKRMSDLKNSSFYKDMKKAQLADRRIDIWYEINKNDSLNILKYSSDFYVKKLYIVNV